MENPPIPPVNSPMPPGPMMPPPGAPPIYIQMPGKGRGSKVAWIIVIVLLLGSAVLNIALLGAVAMFSGVGPFATTVLREGEKDQTVAVYPIVGMIDDRQASRLSQFMLAIRDDDNIKAVVLRVNSGGGGVAASDQMNHMIRQLRSSGKTVVVSMGGVAASGGYYLSAPAEKIYAEPTTVTGSIGVIAMVPIFKGTMDKIGAEVIVLRSDKARENKALMNPFEEPTEQGRKQLLDLLNAMQIKFEDAIFDGRKSVLSRTDVEALSNGKIYTADKALKLKLVDAIGYLDDAVDEAASLAGLSEPHVVHYSRRGGLLQSMLGEESKVNINVDLNVLDNTQSPRILMLWRED